MCYNMYTPYSLNFCPERIKIMGKSSKYPSYSGGTINVNGSTKANTYKRGKNIISDYNMSDDERKAYDYAQKSYADSLSKINVFDNNTQKNLQSQLEAYTLNGQKMINSVYSPMLEDLKTDVASRFGNFDNSVFMDNLNAIETKRAESVSDLAQDVLAKRDELVNNELSQRYTYLNFLQDVQNQMNSNIMNYVSGSQSNSSAGNSYNAQAYAANQSSNSIGNYAKLGIGLAGTLTGFGTATSAVMDIIGKYSSKSK